MRRSESSSVLGSPDFSLYLTGERPHSVKRILRTWADELGLNPSGPVSKQIFRCLPSSDWKLISCSSNLARSTNMPILCILQPMSWSVCSRLIRPVCPRFLTTWASGFVMAAVTEQSFAQYVCSSLSVRAFTAVWSDFQDSMKSVYLDPTKPRLCGISLFASRCSRSVSAESFGVIPSCCSHTKRSYCPALWPKRGTGGFVRKSLSVDLTVSDSTPLKNCVVPSILRSGTTILKRVFANPIHLSLATRGFFASVSTS